MRVACRQNFHNGNNNDYFSTRMLSSERDRRMIGASTVTKRQNERHPSDRYYMQIEYEYTWLYGLTSLKNLNRPSEFSTRLI